MQCDGNTPCKRCIDIRGKTRLYKAVWLRLNLEEADCFRIGNVTLQTDESCETELCEQGIRDIKKKYRRYDHIHLGHRRDPW